MVFSREMNRVRVAVLLLVVLVPGAWAQMSPAPVFVLDPTMTKGAPGAPVTIVEFSDYQ
jgi:protein-disulfide isomerase